MGRRLKQAAVVFVVIVAAAQAYWLYQTYGAYVCQDGRSFRDVDRMGFYSNNEIAPHVPFILARRDHVVFSKASAEEYRAKGDGVRREIAHLIAR